MDSKETEKRAELSGKATDILNIRTLEQSHRRLAKVVKEGMTVLDIGCGTGAITQGIVDKVGPSGKVIGMDNNQNLIEQARKEYANIPNLEFVTGNIYDTGYKNMFDIVTCSRVIQWLSEPLKAVKAMKDATKQGGKVIVLDYNHEKAHWSPDPPKSMQQFYHAFLRWRADAGMDNTIADVLSHIFEQAHLSNITVLPQHEIVNKHDDNFNSAISIWADVAASRGLQMVNDGYITEEERRMAEQHYREWIKTDAISQTLYLLSVEGVKK